MKRKLIGIGALLCAAVFVLSGIKVIRWYLDSRQSQREFQQISELVQDDAASTGIGDTEPEGEREILEQYRSLYEQNPDFVGWISIEGTRIDYPVMQSVEEPDFYLKHNFEKKYSSYGVPYVQADCDMDTADNLIIYGHHMNDDSMFSDLCKYTSADFYQEHKTIRFDTQYSHGEYEIIAVFKTTGSASGFSYHHFVDAENEEEFDAYISECKTLSLYEIEATAEYGERLITLSTCEYSRSNGRMVVVAKQIS